MLQVAAFEVFMNTVTVGNFLRPMRGISLVRSSTLDRYPWLMHGFSGRFGGISRVYGPGSLNMGWTKDDDPKNVAENRSRFARALCSGRTSRLVTLRQTHTGLVRVVECGEEPLETEAARPILRG